MVAMSSTAGPTTIAGGQTDSVSATATLNIVRIYGPDAIDTAIAVSKAAFPAVRTANAVVLARSDFFADALAGGPLAAARGGPLLITPGDGAALDARVRAEIQRVLPAQRVVYVVGGPIALSAGIDAELAGLGYVVKRVQGVNQFATAVAIADELGNPGIVFEATGLDFADALSAVPAAIQARGAILLTDGTSQAPETAAYLAAHPPGTRYAVGGPLAAAGADPTAIAVYGPDLYDTSAAVATVFFGGAGIFGAATGTNFPDALNGGVFMSTGGRLGPMLLVRPSGSLPPNVRAYLLGHPGLLGGYLFGGPVAVDDGVAALLRDPSVIGTIFTGLGFDACDTQPNANAVSKLQAWLQSPYRAVGLYLGGRAAGCPTTWNASTVSSVRGMGWRIIPIYVDLQAPCTDYRALIPLDPAATYNEGLNAANGAVARMQVLGMGVMNAPIYLDVEFYRRDGGACSEAVRRFVSGWTGRLHELGYLAGLYSSSSAAVADLSAVYGNPAYHQLDVIWFANWEDPPNPSLVEKNKSWLPDNAWTGHRRIRQYTGGHPETWGGVSLTIDNDNLDAPVVG